MKRYTKGFTLIELLVVIAIIGILASVVLVSLQSARKKGNDTRVISSVNQIRTALETEYNGSTYSSLGNDGGPQTLAGADNVSATITTLLNDIVAQQSAGGISGLLGMNNAQGYVANGTVIITKDGAGKGYAIYAKLPSDPIKVFCIDGNGKTSNAATYPGAAPASDALGISCQP